MPTPPAAALATRFRQRDIIAYKPESPFRRDGYAQVHTEWHTDEVYAKDTFDLNDTRLTDAELATGAVLFNLADFEERRFLNAEDYHPSDVFVLETRKGLVQRKFLRHGAEELPEWLFLSRRLALRESEALRARAELLSPLADQSYAASPMPEMTAVEAAELTETVRWVERAERQFERSLNELVGILNGGDGSRHIQSVLTDEDHHELVRARRALDSQLAALRAG